MSIEKTLDQEQFLDAPRLFKYGPVAVAAFTAVFSACVIAAAGHRIELNREAEYTKVLTAASTAAESADHVIEETLGRLRTLADLSGALLAAGKDPSPVLRAQLHESGAATHAVVVTPAGSQVATVDEVGADTAWLIAQAQTTVASHPADGSALATAVRGAADRAYLRFASPAGAEGHVVFLIESTAFEKVFRKAFGDAPGWGALYTSRGEPLASVSTGGYAPGSERPVTVFTMQEALAGSASAESMRLLAHNLSADRYSLVAGYAEGPALAEWRHRRSASWVIVGGSLVILAAMGAAFAYSLLRFRRIDTYLRGLATVDPLTNLPNRRSFNGLLVQTLETAKARGSSAALLFIDLDNFKYINDSQGHALGDELLRHVARRLSAAVGPNDKVCRLGGDEFTIISVISAASGGPAPAAGLAARVLEALKEPAVVNGLTLKPRASIGIAVYPDDATTPEALMQMADTAMYEAKHSGRGRSVAYRTGMGDRARAYVHTAQELERGIANNELVLHYQPKYKLATGALVGLEALVRWQHPTRGLVPPAAFIQVAEETGLITELGAWVLQRSVQQVREWLDAGQPLHTVAVNVSALQLRDDAFVDKLCALLNRYQLPGRCLQIELTESTLAENAEKARALIASLRARGVRVALDDFGTGYSSLAALQQYEIDHLKMDRSFVMQVHTPQGVAVCRAIVHLGHAMNMQVVAEGVETEEQAEALRALGCDYVQGFLYAKPMPAVEVGKLRSVTPEPTSPGELVD